MREAVRPARLPQRERPYSPDVRHGIATHERPPRALDNSLEGGVMVVADADHAAANA